jgi:Na+-transporting NADH:ubiquinone oxidoreductase subunit NqrC
MLVLIILFTLFAVRIAGAVILLSSRSIETKKKAKQKSLDFLNFQLTDQQIIKQIIEHKNYLPIARFIDLNTHVYLLEKEDTNVRIHPLNTSKVRINTPKRYCQLEKKFQDKKVICENNVDKALIYYHFEQPYENYILLLEDKCTENIFKLT